MLLSMLTTITQCKPTILVTLDGVRWQEIYNGTDDVFYHETPIKPEELTPNLHDYFVQQGIAIGKETPMIASGPNHVSMLGYLEITRGHPSIDCKNNSCNPLIEQSIFRFFNNSAVFGSWGNIEKTLPKDENITYDIGKIYRFDNLTEEAALKYLFKSNIFQTCNDFLWISLGDTDEWAHLSGYKAYIESLQNADSFIGLLVWLFPNSNIIVTTDHGRSLNFKDHGLDHESERVWLMMRGPNIPIKGIVKTNYISLSNIMPTIFSLKWQTNLDDSILSNLMD